MFDFHPKPGTFYKVKSTDITRKLGVRMHHGAKGDDVAWPGEIGEIVERRWTAATTGEPMSGLWIEFPRGRDQAVSNLDKDDFLKVPKSKVPKKNEFDGFDDDEEEDFEEEEEFPQDDEPQEDDLITSDHHHFYQNGKLVLTVDPDLDRDEMWEKVQQFMEKENFYPNVWFISDHGNVHLMTRRGYEWLPRSVRQAARGRRQSTRSGEN